MNIISKAAIFEGVASWQTGYNKNDGIWSLCKLVRYFTTSPEQLEPKWGRSITMCYYYLVGLLNFISVWPKISANRFIATSI